MTHSHAPAPAPGAHAGARHRRRLLVAVVLIGIFFVVELVTGLLIGSLALISDAGHMAADVVTLSAALAATVLAARPDRSGRRTFGNYRIEVFAEIGRASCRERKCLQPMALCLLNKQK